MQTDNEAINPGEEDISDAQEEREELIKEITDNLKRARSHFSRWRIEARADYDFFSGNQWSDADITKLNEEGRPPITFNRVPRTINAVCGLELNNRQEVRYIPRRIDGAGVNELLTGASKWARDNCDAEDEESESFQDSVICGMGWTETRMDYDDEPEGKIIIERIDPLEMLCDSNAKKRNIVDMRWCAHVKELTKHEIEQMFPGFDVDTTKTTFWNDLEGAEHDSTDAWMYRNDQSDKTSKPRYFVVVQYQWYDKIHTYKVATPDGNIAEFDEDRFEQIKPLVESQNLQFTKVPGRKFYQAFLMGNEFIEEPSELKCGHFTFNCITGLRDRNTGTWFGLVKLMSDPQRWANKWLSQILHIVNTSAKSGVNIEEDAVSNIRKFEEDYASPGSISWFRPGALSGGKMIPKQPPIYPEGIDRLLQYALQSIQDVVGVSLEMLGMTNREQPGYLEEMRKQSSISLLATFFSGLRYYRKRQGRVLARYITEYIADGRLIRITGPLGSQYIPLLRDHLTMEYDVIVDDAPTSPNMKEKTFAILSQVIPQALQIGIPVPPEILDYTPLPEDLVQKWKQLIAKHQQPNPMAEQMKQLQLQLTQLEGKVKESEVYLNYAKAEQAHSTGENEAALASIKMDTIAHEHMLTASEMQAAQHRSNVETATNQMLALHESSSDTKRKDMQSVADGSRKNTQMVLDQKRKMMESQANVRIKAEKAKQQTTRA